MLLYLVKQVELAVFNAVLKLCVTDLDGGVLTTASPAPLLDLHDQCHGIAGAALNSPGELPNQPLPAGAAALAAAPAGMVVDIRRGYRDRLAHQPVTGRRTA